jgi:hypothetical protein
MQVQKGAADDGQQMKKSFFSLPFSLAPSAELTEQLAVLKQRGDCMLTYADVC